MNQCYGYKFRRDIPGDAHSRCGHPIVELAEKQAGEYFFQLLTMITLNGAGMMKLKGLDIKGNQHGIDNGWFCWPLNFDPVWLEECSGYTPKDNNENTK